MSERALKRLRKKKLFRSWLSFCLVVMALPSFLLVDPKFGQFIWLQHRKEMVKKEIAEEISQGIEKEKLVLFLFSLEEAQTKLRWRSDKEFEFNQKLYDVVDFTKEGDKIFFWCWEDREETDLEKEIREIAFEALKKKSQGLINQEELSPDFKVSLFFSYFGLNLKGPEGLSFLNISLIKTYSSFLAEPPTPPPRWLI
ncbi:MAG: hypothetical protein N3B16_07700 [Candidatus Aminicenantes bacterium]|nr:hypothetical protein [Candidatus Aminicenantes bacterium]